MSDITIKTPLAVFTYNRPQHTRQLLNSLTNCSRLDECYIVIFSDASRIPEHVEGVQETRRLIHEWAKQNHAQVVERSENLGLARSIVSGVTDLCNEYGRVIVVEDDLILHPAFIHFMLSGLDYYSNDDRVAQITGYMFPVQNPETPDAFLLPFISTWGWATWERTWKSFQWDVSDAFLILKDIEVQRKFDLNGAYPYTRMLFDRLEGKNQSWGILFYWAVFKANRLVLYPRQSLVKNIGFESGTHFQKGSVQFTPLDIEDLPWNASSDFKWTKSYKIDIEVFSRIQQYLQSALRHQPSSYITRMKVSLSKLFRRIVHKFNIMQ